MKKGSLLRLASLSGKIALSQTKMTQQGWCHSWLYLHPWTMREVEELEKQPSGSTSIATVLWGAGVVHQI